VVVKHKETNSESVHIFYQDIEWSHIRIDHDLIENNPEYWEKVEEGSRWHPKDGDKTYYYIDITGCVEEAFWHPDGYDTERLSIGNVYKTKEQAKAIIDHRVFCEEMLCKYGIPNK